MAINKLVLERESNPEFYKLTDEQKSLTDESHNLNYQLYSFKIPRFWLFKTKHKFRPIFVGLLRIQKDFDNWYVRARKFCYSPMYKMEGTPQEELLTHLQSTATLRDSMNELNNNMVMVANNLNGRILEYDNNLNFLIAMTGLIIAVTGLVVAL